MSTVAFQRTLQPLASAALPLLPILALSIAAAVVMMALVLDSGAPMPSSPLKQARGCDTSHNYALAYAQSTGRVPSSYCPAP